MSRSILACGVLAILMLAGTAAAQEANSTVPPGAALSTPLSQRFALIVLDQTDRDLARGSTTINMMFDTQTGRSWVLEYARRPGTNVAGYVWVEVPYAKPPTD